MKGKPTTFWQHCILLAAICTVPFAIGRAHAAEGGEFNSACDALNRAYVNSRTTTYYSTDAYRLEPNGTRKRAFEIRVASASSYQREPSKTVWFGVNRPPSTLLAASGGPKFTSCTALGDQVLSVGNTAHYSFDWHGPGTSASGEAWIEKTTDRITYLLRRFPSQPGGRAATILEVFDYDPTRAITVSPVEGSAAPSSTTLSKSPNTDLTCSDVNKAYLLTRSASTYTETWYRIEKNGRPKLHSEFRANYMGGVYKLAVIGKWADSNRPLPSLLDRYTPIFEHCKSLSRKSEDGVGFRRYSARWHEYPYEAAVEVFTRPDGKINKMLYRYLDGRWQLPTERAQAVFSYPEP